MCAAAAPNLGPPGEVVVEGGYSPLAVVLASIIGFTVGAGAGAVGYLGFAYAIRDDRTTTDTILTTTSDSAPTTKQTEPSPSQPQPPTPPPPPTPMTRPTTTRDYVACYTSTCIQLAQLLDKALNPLVDPCRNFSQHVCGQFEGKEGDTYVNQDLMTWLWPGIDLFERVGKIITVQTDNVQEKASYYVYACTRLFGGIYRQDSAAVVRFMGRLGLSLSSPPPPGSPSTRDQLLSLHVELAFTYGLSAIMVIRPRPYNSLHVAFNGRMMQAALKREERSRGDAQ
ncbi:uncharacterized protein LOC144153654 [Haemaphysalis longicornis]